MKIKKEVRRNKKINVSEKSRISKEIRIMTFGTGASGYALGKLECQL